MSAAAALRDKASEIDATDRRCLASGETRPRERMVRYVVAPDPALGVVPDVAGNLPGRGLWVTATRAALTTAISRNAFARAARAPVRVDAALADLTEQALARRMVDWLGLARRAGAAVAGFDKTRDAARRSRLVAILEADDASADGSERVAGPEIPRLTVLTRAELGYAFGRDALVHVGIVDAAWALRLTIEAGRLAGFRAAPGA